MALNVGPKSRLWHLELICTEMTDEDNFRKLFSKQLKFYPTQRGTWNHEPEI